MKKFLARILILVLVLTAALPAPQAQAKETNKYLVLVQNKNKTWTAYKDLIIKKDNNLMLKANAGAKAIGLKYTKNSSTKFTLANGSKNTVFTKNSKNYIYNNGKTKTTCKATEKACVLEKANTVHYATLGKLVNTKYYTGSKATDYKVNGYSGVVCFSKYNKITSLPNIDKVKDENNKPVDNKKPVKPNTGNTINIGGIDVPLVDEYVPANKETDGWFANDEKGNSPYYDATWKFNDYIHSKVDNKISVAKDASTIIYTDDNISVAFNGVHDLEYAFKLNKNADKNQYELTIATRLYPGSKYEEEANNTLKLLLAAFTNEVDSLYEVLYTHYEEDDTIISKTKWTQIGSVKVKYDIVGSNNVVYYFKNKN